MTCLSPIGVLGVELDTSFDISECSDKARYVIQGYTKVVARLAEMVATNEDKIETHEGRILNLEKRVSKLEEDNRMLMDNRSIMRKMMLHIKAVSGQLPVVDNVEYAAIDDDYAVVFFSDIKKAGTFLELSEEEIVQVIANQQKTEVDGRNYRVAKISQL